MDKIILKNKTEFEIAEGASLGNIQIQSKDFDGIRSITEAFSEENISKVTFPHNRSSFLALLFIFQYTYFFIFTQVCNLYPPQIPLPQSRKSIAVSRSVTWKIRCISQSIFQGARTFLFLLFFIPVSIHHSDNFHMIMITDI